MGMPPKMFYPTITVECPFCKTLKEMTEKGYRAPVKMTRCMSCRKMIPVVPYDRKSPKIGGM